MTESKESSPDSSTGESSSFTSSRTGSGSSKSHDGRNPSPCPNAHLLLSVDNPNSLSVSTSPTCQSSPRPSGRGSSSTSSLSIGETSYRDLSDIQDEFKILKTLHSGSFSKVLLAKQENDDGEEDEPLSTDTANNSSSSASNRCKLRRNSSVNINNKYLVLKAIPSGGFFTDNFKRELRYNYFLSPHPNIVTSFNISFNWASSFNVYVQEYAPHGDLSKYILLNTNRKRPTMCSPCLSECQVKLIASQLASALEFMHGFKLVHQDLRAENVLVFKTNMSRVKLCDFGSTRRESTLITKGNLISSSSANLLAPEVSYLLPQERYECHRSADVWQMGILLCICLTGSAPWQSAEFTDPLFRQYTNWLKRKSLKVPEPFRKFTPRLVRLLKRLLEPKCHLRSEIREVFKYLGDDWIKPSCKMGSQSSNALQRKESLKKERNRSTAADSGANKGKCISMIKFINQLKVGKSQQEQEETKGIDNNGTELEASTSTTEETSDDAGEQEDCQRIEHWVATARAVILKSSQGKDE
ncbi:unnamed protein product [Orchesella dallaii]|uniref:Protein kinase domain-containing protein n=1 Tax=Orchesella dallaii TaxID=48710 RepID=A0ABP1PWL4_9HEXA